MKRTGVTLMESVVVIGVMTTLLVIITQIFVLNYDVYLKQSARAQNETGAMLAARTISEMTRGASSLLTNQTINGTLYALSDSVLVLSLPSQNASGDVIAGSFDNIAILRDPLDAEKIIIDVEAAPGSVRKSGKRLLTDFNVYMKFRYNGFDFSKATRVSVYLINRQTYRGTTTTSRAWTSIFLRN